MVFAVKYSYVVFYPCVNCIPVPETESQFIYSILKGILIVELSNWRKKFNVNMLSNMTFKTIVRIRAVLVNFGFSENVFQWLHPIYPKVSAESDSMLCLVSAESVMSFFYIIIKKRQLDPNESDCVIRFSIFGFLKTSTFSYSPICPKKKKY